MAKLVHNVQKKQHRERSQTQERSRYGLLEKKKDYKLRATDFHKKQAALKALKRKASTYNPDEYYHAMVRKRTDDRGILVAGRGAEELTNDQVKLLKSQDSNYIRTMRLNELLKIKKQKEELGFNAHGNHTVFVDTVEDQQNFKPEEFFGTDTSMLERRENRLRISQLEKNERLIKQELLDDQDLRDQQDTEKLKQYKLLKSRIEREDQLREVEAKMELSRELMKNGNKKKIVDTEGNVSFKWKNQRKR